MERALVLRERVENSAYSAWSEADQNAYVRMLYTLYRETGMGREKVIQLLSLELNFGSEVFEQSEEEEKGATDQVTIKSKNPVPALQQFCSAP